MTPEQLLASLQEVVRGLSETVQRLSSENETLRSQSTVGAVGTVTMANKVARLNKPTAFSGAEKKVHRLRLRADLLRGNDGRHATDGAASGGSRPKSEANPDRRGWERQCEDALQYPGTSDDAGTEKNDARCTRAQRVRSVPNLVLRCGSRGAGGGGRVE